MARDFNSIHHRALRLMLRPLVRFWLRRGESLQNFIHSLKVVFVEVAVEEFAAAGSKINYSRLSAATGVSRPDVTQIVKFNKPPDRSAADIVTRVINRWANQPEFCRKDGRPRSLSYQTSGSEFHRLVRMVSKDVKPGSILSAMEHANLIVKDGTAIALKSLTHDISQNEEQAFDILARDMQSLLNAVQENIHSSEQVSPNMHLRTEFDNIFVSDIPKIRKWLWREGKAFHKRARAFLSKSDKDINERPNEEAGVTVSITAFSCVLKEQGPSWHVGTPIEEVKTRKSK